MLAAPAVPEPRTQLGAVGLSRSVRLLQLVPCIRASTAPVQWHSDFFGGRLLHASNEISRSCITRTRELHYVIALLLLTAGLIFDLEESTFPLATRSGICTSRSPAPCSWTHKAATPMRAHHPQVLANTCSPLPSHAAHVGPGR